MTKLDFQPGDIVKLQGEVEQIAYGSVYIRPKSGKGVYWVHETGVEMVKRAVRKPKVGDRITGRQVYDTRWKRGTLLRNEAGDLLALNADAQWIPLGENYPDSFEFVDIIHDEWVAEAEYEVVFLP